eukprot:g1768.t1
MFGKSTSSRFAKRQTSENVPGPGAYIKSTKRPKRREGHGRGFGGSTRRGLSTTPTGCEDDLPTERYTTTGKNRKKSKLKGYKNTTKSSLSRVRSQGFPSSIPPLPETPQSPPVEIQNSVPHSCRDDLVTRLNFGDVQGAGESSTAPAPLLQRSNSKNLTQGHCADDGETPRFEESKENIPPPQQGHATPVFTSRQDAREELFRSSIKKAIKAQSVLKQRLTQLEEQRRADIRKKEDEVKNITARLRAALGNCEKAETGWTMELSQKSAALEKVKKLQRELEDKKKTLALRETKAAKDLEASKTAFREEMERQLFTSRQEIQKACEAKWLNRVEKAEKSLRKNEALVAQYEDQFQTLQAQMELASERAKLVKMERVVSSKAQAALKRDARKRREELGRLRSQHAAALEKVAALERSLETAKNEAARAIASAKTSTEAAEVAAKSARNAAGAIERERQRACEKDSLHRRALSRERARAEANAEAYREMLEAEAEAEREASVAAMAADYEREIENHLIEKENAERRARNAAQQLQIERDGRERDRLHFESLVEEAEANAKAAEASLHDLHNAMEVAKHKQNANVCALLEHADGERFAALDAAARVEEEKLFRKEQEMESMRQKYQKDMKQLDENWRGKYETAVSELEENWRQQAAEEAEQRELDEALAAEHARLHEQLSNQRLYGEERCLLLEKQLAEAMSRVTVAESQAKSISLAAQTQVAELEEKLSLCHADDNDTVTSKVVSSSNRKYSNRNSENQNANIGSVVATLLEEREIVEAECAMERAEHEAELQALEDVHAHEMEECKTEAFEKIAKHEKDARCAMFAMLEEEKKRFMKEEMEHNNEAKKALEKELLAAIARSEQLEAQHRVRMKGMEKRTESHVKEIAKLQEMVESMKKELDTRKEVEQQRRSRIQARAASKEAKEAREAREAERRSSTYGTTGLSKVGGRKKSGIPGSHRISLASAARRSAIPKKTGGDAANSTKVAEMIAKLRVETRKRKVAETKLADLSRKLNEANAGKKKVSSSVSTHRQKIQLHMRMKSENNSLRKELEKMENELRELRKLKKGRNVRHDLTRPLSIRRNMKVTSRSRIVKPKSNRMVADKEN